ncbi:MAG TPA: hypothetical protein VHU84_12670 [Lacipirellulaceae bacterium]|jgi:hypothetical protein|nr:hypothetical protein [Lacipirellulaceae bacterium]
MEARITRVVSLSALLTGFLLLPAAAPLRAAGYKTTNFTVSAPTPELAKEIGDQAEIYRRDLSIEWLGHELPAWSKSCPIHAQVAPNLGAGGATTFIFDRGEVYGWKMNIQGSHERILDSVLPHEVTHTIFASHFRQPLPRWADEGACTTMEDRSEIAKQETNLIRYLHTGRGISFSQMFAMKEYPQDVMPLYAQGHSLSEWLIESRGRHEFLNFLADGMKDENWPRAVHDHYGFDSMLTMQASWNEWVKQGRPQIAPAASSIQLASSTSPAGGTGTPAKPGILRLQSPDPVTPIPASTASQAKPVTAVTVAPATASVYAAAAQRAEQERQNPIRSPESVVASNASVYDASRGGAILRR